MGVVRDFAARLVDYDDPASLGSRLRRRRLRPLLDLLARVRAGAGRVRVLDVGGRCGYWSILPESAWDELGLHVTVLNLPGCCDGIRDARFTVVEGDGCDLSAIGTRAFDVAHSNSALEHVGEWRRMAAFAAELRRVAAAYYVQTPYFWSPLEPHFMWPGFHWLPVPVRARMLTSMDLGPYERRTDPGEAIRLVEEVRLLDRWMMRALFPGARITLERVGFVPKSIIAIGEPAD